MSKRELSQVAKELIAAKRRIENEDNWCRDLIEIDGRMCALGSLRKMKADYFSESWAALDRAGREIFRDDLPVHVHTNMAGSLQVIAWVNDFIGHAAVMQMYDLAIATEIQKANSDV